nr:hypothetical transcript [Hymenolepis microstoma]
MSGQVKVIAHETNGFPLDNYPRYLYESFSPGTTSFIFYSKSLQNSYTNRNRPCQIGPIKVQGHTYDYDQAACQWKKTCEYLHNECNCYCPLELLRSWGRGHFLNPTQTDFTREDCVHSCIYEQQIMLVDAAECPYACNTATYQRNNKMENPNATTQDSIQVSFVQQDAVTQNTEEELFGLAKFFSEVGGLSSFFFGFSCLVIFELLESCYRFWNRWIRRRSTRVRKNKNLYRLSKSIALCRGESYAPHCVPNSEDSPIFLYKNAQRMCPIQESLPSTDCDLTVLLEIDGITTPVSIQ